MGSLYSKQFEDSPDGAAVGGSQPLNRVSPISSSKNQKRGSTHKLSAVSQTLKKLSVVAQQEYDESWQNLQANENNVNDVQYQDYEYPFENVVFEGGGVKGQVYCGCLKVLEEVGVKPKRFAGASAGAICAALASVGYTADELSSILNQDLSLILFDHSCGLCSLIPNLITNYGWNPGTRMYEYIGDLLYRKTGNKDITFREIYDKFGNELCVTAVNLNMIAVEYFHPKTTPNFPVRLAVRMSTGIPGIFEAVKHTNEHGLVDTYIDGGLLCNFPIHAFDGWWLSMEPKDSFLNKIQPLSQIYKLMEKKNRFGTFNEKTLGFLVYSNLEQEVMQTELESRVGLKMMKRPNTKLSRSREGAIAKKQKALHEHQIYLNALDRFLQLLQRVNKTSKRNVRLKTVNKAAPVSGDLDDVIDRTELKLALDTARANSLDESDDEDKVQLNQGHIEILFGNKLTSDEVFDLLDSDKSGLISYNELLGFIEKSGIDIQARFQGFNRKELRTLSDFAVGLQDCLLTNVKKSFLDDRDINRIVGINTDYIETTDFKLEPADHDFMITQGIKATQSFLKHYVIDKKLTKKRRGMTSCELTVTEQPQPSNHLEQPTGSVMNDVTTEKIILPPIRGTNVPRIQSSGSSDTEHTIVQDQ